MKSIRFYIFICLLFLLHSSCTRQTTYPDTPIISYNSFTPFYFGSSAKIDSAYLRINFTDGNGDIGYPAQQENAPHNFYAIALLYTYKTKTYDSFVPFMYNIPDITPSGSNKALKGIIQINLESFLQQYVNDVFIQNPSFDTVADQHNIEFKVWLYDRMGNKSNILITSPIYTRHE